MFRLKAVTSWSSKTSLTLDLTLSYLLANLKSRGAASVKLAALLDKHERREKEVEIDYLGFGIPDHFVVGYGLDFAERYRNLPFIAVLKNPEA